MQAYLKEEIQHKIILGPFKSLHVSPFVTREEPNAPFLLKLLAIDTINNHIRKLGKGCMFYKVDAFRHIKLDPNYIHDFIGIDILSRIDASFDAPGSILDTLGLTVSQKKKLLHPSTIVSCMPIDTKQFSLAIPPDKLKEILALCVAWHHKNHTIKCQLQSLLGSLLYISKCSNLSLLFKLLARIY